MIYLDSAAHYPIHPYALDAYLAAPNGNPSSEHAVGNAARAALEQAREKIARLMDCEPDEVYFTSTATEAAATVIRSLESAGYRVFPSLYEHHAITENILSATAYTDMVEARMYGNNETGWISYLATQQNQSVLSICDATAAVGHFPFSFRNIVGIGYAIADGIKFGGVPGAAFLIAKKGAPLSPIIRGGGQERGMRAGTENVPAICAMAAALEWQTEHMAENTQKIAAMRQILFQSLSRVENHKWNTPFEKPCLPHILNVSFDGVDGKALALILSNEGVMVSTGAACSNGLNEPSHVLMAMFHDERRARSAIRISLSHENTPDECVEAAEKIKAAVAYLRSLA